MSELDDVERFFGHCLRVHFFISKFFQSARPCSHLFAVLRLLVDFNDPKVDTLLVRRAGMF